MRKIGAIVGVVLFMAAVANASIIPDTALKLVINSDGTAYITTNTATATIKIDAYEIMSTAPRLNPSLKGWSDDDAAYTVTLYQPTLCWASIEDTVAAYSGSFANGGAYISGAVASGGEHLGSSVNGFGENNNSANHIGEFTGGNGASANFYLTSGGSFLRLGKIINNPTSSDIAGMTFWYNRTDGPNGSGAGNVSQGTIVFLPEPATLSVLLIGGIATLIRRRHR